MALVSLAQSLFREFQRSSVASPSFPGLNWHRIQFPMKYSTNKQ